VSAGYFEGTLYPFLCHVILDVTPCRDTLSQRYTNKQQYSCTQLPMTLRLRAILLHSGCDDPAYALERKVGVYCAAGRRRKSRTSCWVDCIASIFSCQCRQYSLVPSVKAYTDSSRYWVPSNIFGPGTVGPTLVTEFFQITYSILCVCRLSGANQRSPSRGHADV